MDQYSKGDSIKLEISLVDENSTAVDLTGLTGIQVDIYHSTYNENLKTGTYAGGSVTYSTDGTDGVLVFTVEDDLTATADRGIYKYRVTVTESDTDFSDNVDTTIQTGNAFQLK